MLMRDEKLQNVMKKLTILKEYISTSNSLNMTSINISAENFFRDLYTLLGYSFANTNIYKQNSAYIDLIDNANKMAIQVTAQNDAKKISDTISGFFADPKHSNYTLKVLLLSKDAKEYRKDFTKKGQFQFDPEKDIVDINRLIAEINDKDRNTIDRISDFLDNEITAGASTRTELNEVETIMSLLEWLSRDENYNELLDPYECDPEKKINGRFKEHAKHFKDDYLMLLQIYGSTLPEAKSHFGFDGIRSLKISTFLILKSNEMLARYGNNPIDALGSLVEFFINKISQNGFKVDGNAIRYFLLEELIGCNLFSEKER
jgi:hypothetical protein